MADGEHITPGQSETGDVQRSAVGALFGVEEETLPQEALNRLRIDPNAIDEEAALQPTKFAYWAGRYASLKGVYDRLYLKRKVLLSKLDALARAEIGSAGKAATEGQVQAWVRRHEQYEKISSAVLEAEERMGKAEAMRDAWDQRSWMIRTIAMRMERERRQPDHVRGRGDGHEQEGAQDG